jgi:uncharacterized membrane protein
LAAGELVADQPPSTPSRTVPVQFGARIAIGALSGAAFGAAGGSLLFAALRALFGAVMGTLGGRTARARLAAVFDRDPPATLIEDAVAILAALLIVTMIA